VGSGSKDDKPADQPEGKAIATKFRPNPRENAIRDSSRKMLLSFSAAQPEGKRVNDDQDT
jgi:hypothetical protein